MSFLDRIRGHRAPRTPQEADALALRQLEGRGADLSQARHVIHFLYFDSEGDARAAAEVLGKSSWGVAVDAPSKTMLQWCVRADGYRVLGSETIAAFRARFEHLANDHAGEYDGWEAAKKP